MVRFPGLSHLRATVGWDLRDLWEWSERDAFPEPQTANRKLQTANC